MRCAPSSVFTMKLYQGKSKVWICPQGYDLSSPLPPLHHFHTQQQQSCSYTSWKMIFAVARSAAAFLASTKSNFPNHSAVYLSITICRLTRLREGEILEIVLVKLYRVSGDYIWRLLYQEDKKKQKINTGNNKGKIWAHLANRDKYIFERTTCFEMKYNICIKMRWNY